MTNKLDTLLESISISKNTGFSKGQSDTHHLFIGAHNFVWTKPPKKNLYQRPKEWKMQYLPSSFCPEENEAHLIVSTEVWGILKQERNVFKKKILKNITVQSGNPEQPIPRLIELAKMLFEWAAPKGTSYSNKEVKERFKDKKIHCRFALLRVCATYQHTHNNKAPWPKIDEHLEVYYNLIFEIDSYLAKKKASETDFSLVIPPTMEQVEQEMRNNNSFD
ncbi:hypothetical protein BY996DRAFT_6423817 [Phakopsora pachyrhizi]|nr:hypothetical protein BY996DRAFT_6423817 [Phakopsora pachyrhizi]